MLFPKISLSVRDRTQLRSPSVHLIFQSLRTDLDQNIATNETFTDHFITMVGVPEGETIDKMY
jgi:hypothetical protein